MNRWTQCQQPAWVTKMLQTGTSLSHLWGCGTGGWEECARAGKGRAAAGTHRKEVPSTGKLTGTLSSRDLAPGSARAGLGCWRGQLSAPSGAGC